MQIAPSILAADMSNLAGALQTCERGGAGLVHFDVMDGHFVPNLSFGLPVLAGLAKKTQLPMDVHLMVSNPGRLMKNYLEAGARRVAVHWEAEPHLDQLLRRIREGGASPGVALNPANPVELLSEVLGIVDFVLVMSVNPGFGGQDFLPATFGRVQRLRDMIDRGGHDVEIEIDGGVSLENIRQLAEAGAQTFVVGSALFGSDDPEAMIGQLRSEALAGAV